MARGTASAPSSSKGENPRAAVPIGDIGGAGEPKMRQGCPVKTAPTRRLFAYWNERRGTRLAPERGDIEPSAIRDVLGNSFIIAFDPPADHPFRLAGTKVCALFRHELKGEAFGALWDEASRKMMRETVAIVADEAGAVVADASATTAEGTLDLELLLLPLYHRGKRHVRLLGALTPVTVPYWLGLVRVTTLTLHALRHVGPMVETIEPRRFGKIASPKRHRRGLTVYDGGRN